MNNLATNFSKITGFLIAAVFLGLGAQQVDAQSGGRAIPRPPPPPPVVPSGGGAPAAPSAAGGGGGGVSVRLSPLEKALARQKQFEQQQELLKNLQMKSAEDAHKQRQQTLAKLGEKPNGKLNSRLYRLAFEEAKREFSALRSKQIPASAVGELDQPFRLRNQDIDRRSGKLNWPATFKASSFKSLVADLDEQIAGGGMSSEKQCKKFLDDLSELNDHLAKAAVDGDVHRTDYARAKRFTVGLANEIKASNLISLEKTDDKTDLTKTELTKTDVQEKKTK